MHSDDPIDRLLDDLDPDTTKRLLMEAISGSRRRKVPTAAGPDVSKTAELLREKYDLFVSDESFTPGQLVTWKAGLKNKKRPEDGEPAIVVEVLKDPVFDQEQGPGSAYYRERLDIVLGLLDEDGEFLLFHFDSRRFRALEES